MICAPVRLRCYSIQRHSTSRIARAPDFGMAAVSPGAAAPPELSRLASTDAVLTSPDLVGRILELACATPAHVATAAAVCRAWRTAATERARFHLTLTGRRDDWATVASRLPRRLDGLTVCAANVRLPDVTALLTAQPGLRSFTLSHCFGVTIPVAREVPERVAFFAALVRCGETLRSLAVCDVSQLAWPAAVRYPAVTSLSLANCSLLADAHGGVDSTGATNGICASLVELLRCFPSLVYVCLGGVALKAPVRRSAMALHEGPPLQNAAAGDAAGAGDGNADVDGAIAWSDDGAASAGAAASVITGWRDPLHDYNGLDRNIPLPPERKAAIARLLVWGAVDDTDSALPILRCVDVTFVQPHVRAAVGEAAARARLLDLAEPADVRVLAAAAQSAGDVDITPLMTPPVPYPGQRTLLALSTSAQQRLTRATPLHHLVQLASPAPSLAALEAGRMGPVTAGAAAGAGGGGGDGGPAGGAPVNGGDAGYATARAAVVDLLALLALLPADAGSRTVLLERKDGRGCTPLLRAAEAGDAACIAALLAAGADAVGPRNQRDERPLYVAALKGHAAAVGVLLRHYRASAAACEEAAAIAAASAGSGAGAGAASARPRTHTVALGPDGWTALHAAPLSGCVPAVRSLLTLPDGGYGGSDLPSQPSEAVASSSLPGLTARERQSLDNKRRQVHRTGSVPAASSVTTDTPPVAFDGAVVDVGARNRYGRTALHVAVHARSATCVRALLEAGAAPAAADDSGETPFHMASRLLATARAVGTAAVTGSDQETATSAAAARAATARASIDALVEITDALADAGGVTPAPGHHHGGGSRGGNSSRRRRFHGGT